MEEEYSVELEMRKIDRNTATRLRLACEAERVPKTEILLKLTNLFDTSLAEKSAGGVTASKGVGDRLAVGDELPSVLAR